MAIPDSPAALSFREFLMLKQMTVAIALAALPTPPLAADSQPFQRRYCAGMEMERYVPLGGRYDCLSDEYAIEVEWIDEWYSAVGQSLYYAAVTNRKPGIILLCPDSSIDGEGYCRSYIYRLEQALTSVSTPVKVWECFIDRDMTLADCFEPQFDN